jgi:peptidyl-prolyl cis-trans isomerase D
MGLMGYMRDRMGKILAISIGFSLFIFVALDVAKSGGSFFREDRNVLGEAAGEKINYDEFNKKVDQSSAQFKQGGQGALSPQIMSYVQEQVWNQMVMSAILQKQSDRVDVQVGADELNSMVEGNNPDQQIVRAFSDPKTGQFDRSRVIGFLQQLPKLSPDVQNQWKVFLDDLANSKLSEKYVALVTNGLYVNSLEAKDEYTAKNKLVNFKYVTLPYSSIPDSKVTITDDDYKSYYDDHKTEFDNPYETRTFDYVSFNAAPSKEDSAEVKQQAEKLKDSLAVTKNDSLFVQINAETKTNPVYVHKGRLGNAKLDSVMFSAPKGFVYGPYLANGSYNVAKLVDSRVEPDSVKARHILIDESVIGPEKAMAKADSLKKLIEGGKSFADLANLYSADKGSAVKGGELGTFARGAMVPAFEDAAFAAKKGDLVIAASQYGVHLIQIEDTKGSSKVVKVAVVDVPLRASTETQTAVYSKAQGFLASLTKDNFDQQAKKAGLKKETAADVSGTAASVAGIASARDLVRWAFGAQKGDITDKIYTEGDQYVVAQLVQIKPKGILPLADVEKQIQPMVLNRVKGKQLIAKLQAALSGSASLDQVAQKSGTKVIPIQNMVFANPVIPGSSAEYKLVGTIFGSQPNKLSKPIAGQQGVYVFDIDSFTNPPPLTDAIRIKQQLGQALMQRAGSQIFEALKDKANVKDYRYKYL